MTPLARRATRRARPSLIAQYAPGRIGPRATLALLRRCGGVLAAGSTGVHTIPRASRPPDTPARRGR
jgi:hypothetical protein